MKKKDNRIAFAGYVLSQYMNLNLFNEDFERGVLPRYLSQLISGDKFAESGKRIFDMHIYNTYDADPRAITGKFVDYLEDNDLPIYSSKRKAYYKKCSYLYLLAVLVSSYHRFDEPLPIGKNDRELYIKLLEKCYVDDVFLKLADSFCLKSTREKIKKYIWNEVTYLTSCI